MVRQDLIETLARECPNGISFEPMALRLLRQKLKLEEWQIEVLKDEMFQLGNGLWFTREMISDDSTRMNLRWMAADWLRQYGCFSVEQLFISFKGELRLLHSLEYQAGYLRHLGFNVIAWGKGIPVCFQQPPSLNEQMVATAAKIEQQVEEEGGTIALDRLVSMYPQFSFDTIEAIRVQFLPDIHLAEINELLCWRSASAVLLPDNFTDNLTTIVDTLIAINERVTIKNIEFALNLLYRQRFRDEYNLSDNSVFMQLCAKHYAGDHDVFAAQRTIKSNSMISVIRRATRFGDIGIPIGAELIYIDNPSIKCIVVDDQNKVEYKGAVFTVTGLAKKLANKENLTGFLYFKYENEILWDRRLRLEGNKTNKREYSKTARTDNLNMALKSDGTPIIGLQGKPILLSTWKQLKAYGTNCRLEKAIQKIRSGESKVTVASYMSWTLNTLTVAVSSFATYFKICEHNGIDPKFEQVQNV